MIRNANLVDYYDLKMNLLDTKDLITTYLDVPSIPFRNNWGGGADGIPPYRRGVDYLQRPISATIHLDDHEFFNFELLKGELYGIFGFNKPFFIVDRRRRGLRYRAVLESNYNPIRLGVDAVVPFITEKLPFAESIGTTQDIQRNGISSDDELWGFGMGLIADDEALKYTHEGKSFQIYNAGNESIHPFEQELKITISNVEGSTGFLELINETNGTVFRVNEVVGNNRVIVLDGPNITSNGVQYLRNTNRKYIVLEPGWNQFKINGATNAKVEFDFRFYYQ